MAHVTWNGKRIMAKAAAAAMFAVDKTTSEAVSGAKREHAWMNDTGIEEASIMMRPASFDGVRVQGRWGAYTDYSLYLEIGTSRIGQTAFERAQEGEMWTIPPPLPPEGVTVRQDFTILPPNEEHGFRSVDRPSDGTGPRMAPRPFLRPQADIQNPQLARRMFEAFTGLEVS